VRLTAQEIADATGGEIRAGAPEVVASSFSIDSRALEPGACFVALVAERDGHEFVKDAVRRGARVALVSRPVPPPPDCTVVQVPETWAALSDLGRAVRARLRDATVVGITGSVGKTATKDLLAAALRTSLRVTASPVSFNNEAGLPLTLLAAEQSTQVVVAEMGARFAGNIRDLCVIARPDVGVVTNVGLAHAGPLGGLAGIAHVKGELVEALPARGIAVLNGDDGPTRALAAHTSARVVLVGRADDAGIHVTDVNVDDQLRPSFRLEAANASILVRLALRGEHQVLNAALAGATALELGVAPAAVAAGLEQAQGAPWRMELARTADGITVLNDAYNANPASTSGALRSLARLPVDGRRLAVLGEMRELGDESADAHEAVGRLAQECGVDVLVVVGEAAGPIATGARVAGGPAEVVEVSGADDARDALARRLRPGDVVLVKASRAVGLEQVAESLLERVPS
jgi:UDP-N-acetylmuramoyl-tripeptide--D-alanyl-D-alanine ligase